MHPVSLRWLGPSKLAIFLLICLLAITSCQTESESSLYESGGMPFPGQNPPSKEGIAFGKALFESSLLSKTGNRSCRSCHHPDSGFSTRSKGVGDGNDRHREIPSLFNLAWSPVLFWDGREENLESLILKPIQNSSEMDLDIQELMSRVNANPSLKLQCKAAFQCDTVSTLHISRALSQYIRSLVRQQNPKESFGQQVFTSHCSRCHSGPSFTDFGLRMSVVAASGKDSGRYHITHDPADVYSFKTPGLAAISLTAPYMHDGRYPDLESVLIGYSGKPGFDSLRMPMVRKELIRFLKTL